MQRIVHLDFKGAPPRVPFLEKVLSAIKAKGTTGVLIEWEDTFPYTGDLVDIGSVSGCGGDDMYNINEVKHIFQFCKDNEIEVIQAIPIIYQMEFLLKHTRFKNLRSDPESPSEINLSNPTTLSLVYAMLEQILDLQPYATKFLLGPIAAIPIIYQMEFLLKHTRFKNLRSDPESPSEINLSNPTTLSLVYAMLEQILDLQPYATKFLLGPIAVSPDNLEDIYKSEQNIKQCLEHIRDVATFLKKKLPNLTILIRDDFLKSSSLESLKEYQLGDLVQPVVCHSKEYFNTDGQLWDKYSQLFPKVWAGSAFRGAAGGNTIFSESDREANNHESWRREIRKYSPVVDFAGIVLIGWSRYDHYGALCELLPVSLPHIEVCYNVLEEKGKNIDDWAIKALSKSIARFVGANCAPTEPLADESMDCLLDEYPGAAMNTLLYTIDAARTNCLHFINSDQVKTWLNPWQIRRKYTSESQVQGLVNKSQLYLLLCDLVGKQNDLIRHLNYITGPRSAGEWIRTYITPIVDQLSKLLTDANDRCKAGSSVAPEYSEKC